MLEIIFESQKLRDQIPLSDEELLGHLERIGLRNFQYDLGRENQIILRLSYEFLRQLVEIQNGTPLEFVGRIGTGRANRGRVLAS